MWKPLCEVTWGNAALYSIAMATRPTLRSCLATAAAYNRGTNMAATKNLYNSQTFISLCEAEWCDSLHDEMFQIRWISVFASFFLFCYFSFVFSFVWDKNVVTLTDPQRENQVSWENKEGQNTKLHDDEMRRWSENDILKYYSSALKHMTIILIKLI